jgi:signal transduction histidine kinase
MRISTGYCIIKGMTYVNLFTQRLKEACALTQVCWVAQVLRTEVGGWQVGVSQHLPRRRQDALLSYLTDKTVDLWLSGTLTGPRVRSRTLVDDSLACGKLYAFPGVGNSLVLVGVASELCQRDQRIWKLAACFEEQAVFSAPGDVQDTVLELQQTQQELQARISAQLEAEARLIQAAKLAAVGEMAAGVAHELNNPLTSVVGFTELVLEDLPLDSPSRKDLELVLQEAIRARSVVRRLLDFARQGITTRVKTDINEIVEQVLMLTKHLMNTSRVQPEIRLGAGLPWVSVDQDQIKQVIINLINNALYAMPQGGRLVVETAQQSLYNRQWITLTVRDTGVGIPPENLERIFEPFFTTRGDRGGTGLGLSVTYGIVTDHAGMIEVESEVQAGSTFTVWLPLEEPA